MDIDLPQAGRIEGRPLPQRSAFLYEVPPPLINWLVHGTTVHLFCPDCRRSVYPNVIDMVARYHEDQVNAALKCHDGNDKQPHEFSVSATAHLRQPTHRGQRLPL